MMAFIKNRLLRDGSIVVGLLVLAILGDFVNRNAIHELAPELPATDVLLLTAATLPLLWRRSHPLSVLLVVTGAFLACRVVQVPEGTVTSIAMFVAVFSAGAHSHHRRRDLVRVGAIVASMGMLVWALVDNTAGLAGSVLAFQIFSLLLNVAFFAAGWVMGDLARQREEDKLELARRADELETQRHQLATQAVADERLRIARELHDVVGHHVSLMGVQAGAARRVLDDDRDRAAELLASIESSGRSAVSEMGRLVGFLRRDGEDSTVPSPTLEHVDGLVAAMRDAGLAAELHRVGRSRPLDVVTDLSAYRIIQESLTNALKHASRPQARVEIAYLVDGLSIRVRNPSSQSTNGGGRGLRGMRERAGLAGGTLAAGRRSDGWFEVSALLPYGPDS